MILVGARNSLAVAVVAAGVGLLLGAPLGLLAAARRGWIDEVGDAQQTTWSSPSRPCCWRS